MSAEFLSSIAGVALSLFFSYVPGLREKFHALESDYKRLVMLGALLLSALAVLGLSCVGWYDLVSCDQAGIKELIELFFVGAIANQSAYMLTPKGKAQP